MSDHDDITRRAAVFAENVRREMRHMPADAVADITDGLEADTVASLADGGTLPDAGDYARDLMRAAGFTEVDSPRTSITGRVVLWLRTSAEWLRREASGLEPAWWVFRAWVMMQALGWMISDVDSTYWFLGQWGGEGIKNGFVGVIFLAVFLWVSVRIGRDGSLLPRRAARIFSLCLACFAGLLLVSETYSPSGGYFITVDNTSSPCSLATPVVTDMTVVDAHEILSNMGFGIRVIERNNGYDVTHSEGLREVMVVDQSPGPTEGPYSCGGLVTLYVDLQNLPGAQTTTTNPTSGPSSRSTTTVTPKATTSIAP